jgi:probable F420-dependent oxidoreductase
MEVWMKFGLGLHRLHAFGFDPSGYARIAKKAEEVGFESLWVGDHLVFPEVLPPTYPYAESGTGPAQTARVPWLDPLITLTYLAAATERIRLGTDVYILPLRDPFVTAKAIATLDIMSKGRVIFGVGLGWLKEEFDAAGQEFHNRGQRCDEILEIITALWTQGVVEFSGQHYAFGPVNFEPKPMQRPYPPIHRGGISRAAIQWAGERCDGWMGVQWEGWEKLESYIQQLREVRVRAGRDMLPFEVSAGMPSLTASDVRRFEDLGVARLKWGGSFHVADQRLSVDDALDQIEQFAESILQKFDND